MFRKVLDGFTATHFTILASIAILAPSGLLAAGAFTSVTIVDPTTGTASKVDSTGRLLTTDPLASYATDSRNFVRITGFCGGPGQTPVNYRPPNNKAFILKAVDFTYYGAKIGTNNFEYILRQRDSSWIAGLNSPSPEGSESVSLGNGYYLRNGEAIVQTCAQGAFLASLVGYLVPASAVPPSD